MTLTMIVLATLASGLLSVLVAATLTLTVLSKLVRHLVSLSAGVLLGTALLHVLPEAFAGSGHAHALHIDVAGPAAPQGPTPQALFATLLAGLLFFWLLEKVELFRHVHHHEGDGHDHHHHFDAEQAGRGGYAVLVGDAVHNFCDGVIIAAAFLTNPLLGAVTTLAIAAHEVPQEAGDFIVLLNAGFSRRRALLFNALAGLSAVAGGVAGYFLVRPWQEALPYLLVVASSSFIYVALADLIPQMQQRLGWRATVAQVAWLGAGLVIVYLAMTLLHSFGAAH
jgi:zinc and cadmium transporter